MLQEGLSRRPAFFESVAYQPPPPRPAPASIWGVLNPNRAGFRPPTFEEWLTGEEHAAAVANAKAVVTPDYVHERRLLNFFRSLFER